MTTVHPGFDRFLCPIDQCDWTHDQPPMEIPDGVTETDLIDLGKLHNAQTGDTLRDHYASHPLEDWLSTVARLKQLLDARPPVILCLGCYIDRHNAQRAGRPLPPLNPAQLIVNGGGMCPQHVQIADGPVMPDRTASGLLLPGQQAPGLNGHGLGRPNAGN